MLFTRVTGPGCPKCGYEGSTLLTSTERRRYEGNQVVSQETVERRECEECGCRYAVASDTPEAVVVVQAVRCPSCDSTKTTVTSTRAPIRYHRCHGCGRNFKSLET